MVDELIEQIRLATKAITDFGIHLFDPTIRLGVTGLSNAGKTVFISALIHGLVNSCARCYDKLHRLATVKNAS